MYASAINLTCSPTNESGYQWLSDKCYRHVKCKFAEDKLKIECSWTNDIADIENEKYVVELYETGRRWSPDDLFISDQTINKSFVEFTENISADKTYRVR
eukprot:307810_1